MIRSGAALFAVLALAGCAGQQLMPAAMPSVAAIEAQQASLATVGDVPGFYRTGLFMVQEQCGSYFDEAVMAALKAARTSGQAQLLSGLATGLMGLAGAGGPAVGAIGLAAAFGQNMIANSQDNSLAGADPAATATLVAAAQSALITAESDPATAPDAIADLYAVARACSPAGIKGLEEQALAAAPSHLVINGSPAPASTRFGMMALAPPRPARPVLPTVTVR